MKVTHPQYERVQGMVKVWRVKDLPRVPMTNSDGTIEQTGPAEQQGIMEDMMLVGINGESILRQRNTWRETLLRLMHTARPVVLTFRVVPTGAGLLSEQKGKEDEVDAYQTKKSEESGEKTTTAATPGTPSIRGSRDIDYLGARTPTAFADMIHAGQISLSENRKRSTDSRGNLRYGPKSTNGRLRYKKLHGSKKKRGSRHLRGASSGSNRRSRRNTIGDVLDSHSKISNRPMMSATLMMFHQPESIAMGGRCVGFYFFFGFSGEIVSFSLSLSSPSFLIPHSSFLIPHS